MNQVDSSTQSDSNFTSASLSSAETAFCGACAGLVSRFVIAPLDVVKIRLQLQTQRATIPYLDDLMARRRPSVPALRLTQQQGGRPPYVVPRFATNNTYATAVIGAETTIPQPLRKYNGMWHALRLIAREEGIRSLWKGNLSAEYLYLSYGAVQFLTYHETEAVVRALATSSDGRIMVPMAAQSFLNGAISGCVATIVTYPFDLLRTRFAAQGEPKIYTGMVQAIRHIHSCDGLAGFYRGLAPSLAQIAPYIGLMFGTFDSLKRLVAQLKSHRLLPATHASFDDAFCGALAGTISKAGVFPMDVVRKRMQVQGPDRGGYVVSSVPQYDRSILGCLRQIVKQEGVLGLYKGLTPGIIKAAPASAVTFMVYGQTRAAVVWLKERWQQ